jgi:ABC-2 type transport system ATP-binding protein
MCDRIAIINKGNLVALDTTEKLLERIESKKIKFKVKNLNDFNKIKLNGVKFSKTSSEIIATYDKNKFKFDQIINTVKNNAEILDISTDEGSLEDIFLQVTNK